ncbi:MAG: hypothetical protein CMN44_00530 [SAR116 cluster bacterium]|nr:hypothetical protein [SAR116 cluster bacterium]RPH12198.1 MAG: DUF2062 domain-containing protein [Alphaproteobacteria bacterium TMED54]
MSLFQTKLKSLKNLFSLNYHKRASLFYFLKLIRVKDSVDKLAIGFACGAMVSFTPFIGFHFFLAIIFAFILRGNIVASLIGTFIGNPFTFPFIWIFIYRVGNVFFKNDQNFSLQFTFESLFNQGYEILAPMLIGSLIVSIPIWFITFFSLKFLILSFKKRKV